MDPFWASIATKMVTSAVIVVAASLLVERSGPVVGAAIATLPISAGPAFAFLAAEHGPAFVERTTVASLAVNAATIAFVIIYAILAQRRGMIISVGLGFGAWLAAAWMILNSDVTFAGAIALNVLAFAVGFPVAGRYRTARALPRMPRRWWEIPVRAIAVMTLVAIVLAAGRLIGPRAAGIAAIVPIVLTSIALIMHPRVGGPASAALLANSVPGMVGFAMGIALLHLLVVPLGSTLALVLALGLCVAWNTGLLLRQRAQALREAGS